VLGDELLRVHPGADLVGGDGDLRYDGAADAAAPMLAPPGRVIMGDARRTRWPSADVAGENVPITPSPAQTTGASSTMTDSERPGAGFLPPSTPRSPVVRGEEHLTGPEPTGFGRPGLEAPGRDRSGANRPGGGLGAPRPDLGPGAPYPRPGAAPAASWSSAVPS